ncbi:hypothetical protein V1291_002029 [Nitrobacteraceae bacterium AZCC 1564]
MALFSGKRLVCRAFAAGIVVLASLAAQPAMAADDLPAVDDVRVPAPPPIEEEAAPPPQYYAPAPRVQRPYAPEVYERESYAAIPPMRGERTALYPRPVLPPYQVVTIIRSSGYVPLGRVNRRGWVYTVAAAGPRGIEGRLVIDARTGRIMRFVPALADDVVAYSPPPGPPLYQQDYRRAPRPPAPVPRVAKGNAHGAAPKATSQSPSTAPAPAAISSDPSETAKPAATSATKHPVGPPVAERPAAVAPLDKAAEAKPAATVGATPPPPAAPATASTLKLWPTQAMPPVQPLD